ncbi:MAG: HlyD family efflux transporter periplasmic adaptor subunit [Anaerovoracaceae bacterium]|jgi:putative membrane fusion protein
MPKLNKKIVLIYILILVLLYVIIAVIPSLTGALTRTETIKEGELKVKDDVKCYIVRDETVYTASQNGKMKITAGEGALIKKGTKLLDFDAASGSKNKSSSQYKGLRDRLGKNVVADSSGVSMRKGYFSTYVDGYEDYFTPERMDRIKRNDAESHSGDAVNLRRTKAVKGDPIYKIADNSNWYILCWIKKDSIGKYKVGNEVQVKLPGGTVAAYVDSISKDMGEYRVILRTNRYYSDLMKTREAEASVITSDSEGLLVDNSCIVRKHGQAGVYVKSTTGDYVFRPVQVLGTDGEKSLVSESAFYDDKGNPVNTVEMYDEVLKHPDRN